MTALDIRYSHLRYCLFLDNYKYRTESNHFNCPHVYKAKECTVPPHSYHWSQRCQFNSPAVSAKNTPVSTLYVILILPWFTLKGSQVDAFCHRPYCTVTLNQIFAVLKKKLIIRVKESYEHILLWKTRQWVKTLFISIFLRNRSLSNVTWICCKKAKIGKVNRYLTKLN